MAGIPEDIIDQVRDRTDIVEVISRHIPLKKAGRDYKACCPFHHEKTPSFSVSPARQIYRCFGCGVGGNVFSFLMKYERLEFPEAVRELAKKAGVAIPDSPRFDREKSSLSEKLHSINEVAAAFFRRNLLSDRTAVISREYITKRKLGPQIVDKFKLGYASKSWDGLLGYLKKKGYDDSVMEKSGLLIKGKDGRLFDRFRDRIVFPISDSKGKIKGFGSRVLDSRQPKYMNSPETFIYNKRNYLYGLDLSWEDIRDKDSALVVEGYLDLLSPYQHGIKNVVASLGTSLTVEQVRMLKRFTNNIIMLFDSDTAGENATVRSLDLLVEEDVKVRVAQLPEGHDPDSFINKYGPEVFRKMLDSAQDLFDYKINLLLSRYDVETLDGKATIAGEMLPLISKIKNAIIQAGYLKRLAEILSVEDASLKAELKKVKPDYSYRYRPVEKVEKSAEADTAEKIIAGLMLEDKKFIQSVKEKFKPSDFKDLTIRTIVNKLYQLHDENKTVTPSKLIDCFKHESDIGVCISDLTLTCETLMDKEKSLEDCMQWIKQNSVKEKLKGLCGEIKLAQDSKNDSKVVELVTEYSEILKTVKT